MKKTKELAKDSLFCAIVCTFILIFNLLSTIDYMYISMIITVFIGCYFQNKKLSRPFFSSLVICGISLLMVNPLYVLLIIIPSLMIGFISTIFLKYKIKFIFFFLILTAVCFGLNVVMELSFVKYIIGMDLTQYILADDIFGINDILSNFSGIVVTSYMIVIFIISVFEILILYNLNKIYKKRIMPLIGEKK